MSNCVSLEVISRGQKPKFGQLILGKNRYKFVATRCPVSRLKCTKIDFGWGYMPKTPLGELTALPRTPSWNKGNLLLREREGKRRRGRGVHMCILKFSYCLC